MLPLVLTCEECSCTSAEARGWLGYLVEDPEGVDPTVVCTYCPPCAERELEARPRELDYV